MYHIWAVAIPFLLLAGVRRSNTITVHNRVTVRVIHTDAGKADVAMKYFGHQLTDGVKEGLPAFIGEPRPLDNPISTSQISYAASKLKSNRASGPTFRMSRSRTLITVSTK